MCLLVSRKWNFKTKRRTSLQQASLFRKYEQYEHKILSPRHTLSFIFPPIILRRVFTWLNLVLAFFSWCNFTKSVYLLLQKLFYGNSAHNNQRISRLLLTLHIGYCSKFIKFILTLELQNLLNLFVILYKPFAKITKTKHAEAF